MPDDKQAPARDAPAPPAADRSAGALAELMEGAKALQTIQAQVAQDAMRLPEPRLDEAGPGHHFVTPDGRKGDAQGQPVQGERT